MNWNQAYLYEKNFKNRTEEREREEEKADDKEEDDKDEKISLFHSYFWDAHSYTFIMLVTYLVIFVPKSFLNWVTNIWKLSSTSLLIQNS